MSEAGEWACLICSLKNSEYLIKCEACTTPRERTGKVVVEAEWICGMCTFSNENISKKCSMCDSEKQIVIAKQGTKRKLGQQKEEEKDESSESDIEVGDYEEVEDNEDIEEDEDEHEYAFHFESTNDIDYLIIKNPAEIDAKKSFLPPVYELQALSVLNDMQTKALQLTVEKSKEQSLAAHSQLLRRVRKLGFTDSQLEDTLRYVRDSAPVIIHIYLDRHLGSLLEDTHYRNQFETNQSGGTLCHKTRTDWENRLFHSIYNNSSAFDRVKYGVLNILRDPHGARSCHQKYGDSYLVLKNVRLRCTFASGDTSNNSVQISCCEYYEHVLMTYTDAELQDVIAVATDPQGLTFKTSQSGELDYKEIQIHGPVAFDKHVEAIVVHPRFRNDTHVENLLARFAEQNHCNILWMDTV